MQRRRRLEFILVLGSYLAVVILVTGSGGVAKEQARFVSFAAPPFPAPGSAASGVKPEDEKYSRDYQWVGVGKRERRAVFAIVPENLKNEWRSFGVPREMQKPQILEQKGFTHIGGGTYIVNYVQVFIRNLTYFKSLAASLAAAIDLSADADPLPEFLVFTQNITYEKPPAYYRNKFINSYFPPLVCLYEKYGDCDSKSMLLGTFLAVQNPREKQALVLIRAMGLSHAFLALKRPPLPGMSSIFVEGSGYYIPVETSGPGWAPGFASERVLSILQTGKFMFQVLP